eukprot:TRINITY_DN10967_c0_g2_i1.p3 TRINITY_DN10967_c0_g2~~TRINITY_DN10967_c0_g2_i1.p3  ORF type:complete len:116 (-),score=24.02 TRINITY_DN10967_c0_g2_i1:85-432(-)
MIERHRIDRGIDLSRGKQRRQGRGEAQRLGCQAVIERLDAEPVPGHDQPAGVPFVQDKGEHAVEAVDRPQAPLLPGFEDDLGVPVGGEARKQTKNNQKKEKKKKKKVNCEKKIKK